MVAFFIITQGRKIKKPSGINRKAYLFLSRSLNDYRRHHLLQAHQLLVPP